MKNTYVKKLILSMILVLTTMAVLCLGVDFEVMAEPLTPRNNGQSVISRLPLPVNYYAESYFKSLIDQSGHIVFFYNLGEKLGFCTGRYNIDSRRWEMLTSNGWSSDPGAIPMPIAEGFLDTGGALYGKAKYRFLRLTENSDEIFAVVSGMDKLGPLPFDVHGSPYNFVLQGDKWHNRYSNITAASLVKYPVVYTWGFSSQFDFAANGSGQGLFVTIGYDSPGFFPARYDQNREAANKYSYWTNWRDNGGNIGWDVTGTARTVFAAATADELEPEILTVGYAGTDAQGGDVYLFNMERWVFRYNDGDRTWRVWNNNHWEPDQSQSAYQNVFNTTYFHQWSFGEVLRCGNEVLLFQSDFTPSTNLMFPRYLKTDGTTNYNLVLPDVAVPGVPPVSPKKSFAVLNDPAGNIVIYYLANHPTTQLAQLYRVTYNGQWGAPEGPFYTASHPADQIQLLDVVYTTVDQFSSPVVFIRDGNKILCLTDEGMPIWDYEQSVVFTDEIPVPANIDSSLFSWEASYPNGARNGADNLQAYPCTAGFLSLDADGYLYAPHSQIFPLVIHPPGADDNENSVFWGAWWNDNIYFPGQVVVDNTRNRIFFFDRLDGGGGGSTAWSRLRWLSRSYRDRFIYRGRDNNSAFPFPENNGIIWGQYDYTHLKLPAGAMIDEPAGLLYASSALTGEIWKYDIATGPQEPPIELGVFISGLRAPIGIVRDENGRFYIVESAKHRVSIFEPGGTYIESFGELGREPGQFYYPTLIAYSEEYGLLYVADPMNKRVQVFDKNSHQFLTQWGVWPNDAGLDFKFLGGIAADGPYLYASSITTSGYYYAYIHRFTVHDEPPSNVQLIQPQDGTNVSGQIQVVFSAQDDWGMVQAELVVDGEAVAGQSYDRLKDICDFFYWRNPLELSSGSHTLAVRVTDLRGQSMTSEVITITVNQPPRFTVGPFSATINEGEHLSFDITAKDPDGAEVTLEALNLPEGATFSVNPDGGETLGAPNSPQGSGVEPNQGAASGTVIILGAPQPLRTGSLVDTVPISVLPATGRFNWTPDYTDAGGYTVTFRATDLQGVEAFLDVHILVINTPPPLPPKGAAWPSRVSYPDHR